MAVLRADRFYELLTRQVRGGAARVDAHGAAESSALRGCTVSQSSALAHTTKMRWNEAGKWIYSDEIAQPPIISAQPVLEVYSFACAAVVGGNVNASLYGDRDGGRFSIVHDRG